jgi:hypothetical protein
MARPISILPQIAIFFAGVAAGALTSGVKKQGVASVSSIKDLQAGLAILESKLAAQELAYAERFKQMETRAEEHSTRLADVPSMTQIIGAMEQLLTKTMASLDNRLTAQAKSIDTLRSTVSQTDSLLGKVLESLDALQIPTDPTEAVGDPLFNRRLS